MEDKIREEIGIKHNIKCEELLNYLVSNHLDEIENADKLKDRFDMIIKLIKENSITDTLSIIKRELKIDLLHPLRVELRCCIIFITNIINNNINKVVVDLKNDYLFLERLYIRIKLLKDGWKPISIETFIKRHYKLNYTLDFYKLYYCLFKKIFQLKDEKHFKGRPSLPLEIKNIIKGYRNVKNKETMTLKYNISKDLNKLFTKDEIQELILLTSNSNINNKDTLKKKLYTLCKYT